MVFQNYALYPHKTIYENLSFPLRLRKLGESEIDLRVKRIAGILGSRSSSTGARASSPAASASGSRWVAP